MPKFNIIFPINLTFILIGDILSIKLVSRYKNYPYVRLAIKFDTMTAPDNIRLTGQTSKTSVRLNWNKVKCDGYIIEEMQPEKGGIYEEIMRVDENTTTVKLKNRF